MITLFSRSFLEKQIKDVEIPNFDEKMKLIHNWRSSIIESRKQKETSIKSAFINVVFEKLLGYKEFGSEGTEYHFKEEWNVKDIGRADFVLGELHNDKAEVVGELKGLRDNLDAPQRSRKDLKSAVQQGLEYLSNMPEYSKFLLVSNQNEIRIYKRGVHNRYDSFFFVLPPEEAEKGKKDLTDATELKRFIFLLCKDNLLTNGLEKSKVEKILETQSEEEKHLENKFYAEYKELREKIFFSLLEKNPEYQTKKSRLLSLTQKFLDRIIFCWFCEDSREQLLPPDVLGRIIAKEIKDDFYDKNYISIYGYVKHLFRAINDGNPVFKIDEGYNGGLFAEDKELDNLNITNDIFEVIGELSKYDFGNDEILNVNVLGHIFEQSISDLEQLKSEFEGEEYDKKTSKRKKEGVYYTPEYITKYIVENTVGKWLEEKMKEAEENNKKKRTRKEESIYIEYQRALQNIKVLDPACGSGAFLVQAFDYLLNENKRVVDMLNSFRGSPDQYEIFDNYKYVKLILQKNLYGVDLNFESVEITKLSLWLKTAEKNKRLTDIDSNIKCGNSLIDDPEIAGEKAFKWENEFPDIMNDGGFDCVIGNPPYVRPHHIDEKTKKYLWEKSNVIKAKSDLYSAFIEKGIKLCKNNGFHSFIVPHTWLGLESFEDLRKFVLESVKIISFTITPKKVFQDATVETIIFVFQNTTNNKSNMIDINKLYPSKKSIVLHKKSQDLFKEKNIITITNNNKIIEKIESNNALLGDMINFYYGLKTADDSKFLTFNPKNEIGYKKLLRRSDFSRYLTDFKGEYVYYNPELMKEHKKTARPGDTKRFETEKIIIMDIAKKLVCTYDDEKYYIKDALILHSKNDSISLKYLITIINSKAINYYYKQTYLVLSVAKNAFLKLPISDISLKFQQPFIEKADMMLTLNKELHEKKQSFFEWLENAFSVKKRSQKLEKMEELPKDAFTKELEKANVNIKDMEIFNQCIKVYKDIKSIKDEVDKTDDEIDKMVYDLYELTEEERKIIEDSE